MRHGRTDGCPGEEVLCGFADGSLSTGRGEIESHLAGCDACLGIVADLALAARTVDGADLDRVPLELERRAQGRAAAGESADAVAWWHRLGGLVFSYRTAGVLAATSLVALAILGGDPLDRLPDDSPSEFREAATEAAPVPIAPRGELAPEERVTFRWEPCAGAERSVITIVDAEAGRVVAREAVSAGEYTLSWERLAATGGNRFEWTVECARADGRVAISPAVAFETRRSPTGE